MSSMSRAMARVGFSPSRWNGARKMPNFIPRWAIGGSPFPNSEMLPSLPEIQPILVEGRASWRRTGSESSTATCTAWNHLTCGNGYIDNAYRPFAPRGLQEYVADLRLVINGKTMPRHSSLRPRSRRGEEDPLQKRRERFRPAAERGWDGATQLEAMDAEGIDVAVVYPSRGLFAQAVDDLDPAFAAAIA